MLVSPPENTSDGSRGSWQPVAGDLTHSGSAIELSEKDRSEPEGLAHLDSALPRSETATLVWCWWPVWTLRMCRLTKNQQPI